MAQIGKSLAEKVEVISTLHNAKVPHGERSQPRRPQNISPLLIHVLLSLLLPLVVCELVIVRIVRVKEGGKHLLVLLQLHSVDDGQGDEIVTPLIDALEGVPRQVLAVEEHNSLESMPEEASQPPVSEGRVIEEELAQAGVLQVFENVSKCITDGHFLLVTNPQELLTKLHRQMQLVLNVIWSTLVLDFCVT